MLNWLKGLFAKEHRDPRFDEARIPPLLPANEGYGAVGKFTITGPNSGKSKFDLASMLQLAMKKQGHRTVRTKDALLHLESGCIFQPQLAHLELRDDGSIHTMTTIQVNHPVICPDGVFEFQHSVADSFNTALAEGIDSWAQTDLVVLMSITEVKPESVMQLEMTFPEKDGQPERKRRALLGPVQYYAQEASKSQTTGDDEHPPFCTCCLLTQSLDIFKKYFEGNQFYALRLYAARMDDGTPAADCRINGEDCEEGKAALMRYVERWPEQGFEFRKQYVVIQNSVR